MKQAIQKIILIGILLAGGYVNAQAQNSPLVAPTSAAAVAAQPPSLMAVPTKVTNVAVQPSSQTVQPALAPSNPPIVQSPAIVLPPDASTSAIPLRAIALPADIASLTAKEILAANNQVVSQVATMYQHLGLFITIMLTLLGLVASALSYVIRKSVQEFIQEWTKKFERREKIMNDEWANKLKAFEDDVKLSLEKIHNAVNKAEGSAIKAARHELSLEDNMRVLDQNLKQVDRLKMDIVNLKEQPQIANPPQPLAMDAPMQVVPEPTIAGEDAEVANFLKDKINPAGEEGLGV